MLLVAIIDNGVDFFDEEVKRMKEGWLYNQFVQLNKKMIHCESCVKI